MERRTTLLAEQEKAAKKKPGKSTMSWLGGQKNDSKGRSGIVTVLDVGSEQGLLHHRQAYARAARARCCAAAPTRCRSSALATRNRTA